MKGKVYLLGDWEKPNVYKIGVTKNDIENRIKKLQTGNSGEIYLINYHESEHPFLVENMLHKKFFIEKVKNEWFELKEDDVFKFKEYCNEIEEMFDVLKDNPFFKKYL